MNMKNKWVLWMVAGVVSSICYLAFSFAYGAFLNETDAKICSVITLVWCLFGDSILRLDK